MREIAAAIQQGARAFLRRQYKSIAIIASMIVMFPTAFCAEMSLPLAGSWTLEEAAPAILQTLASIGDWVLSALWVYDESIARLRCRARMPTARTIRR